MKSIWNPRPATEEYGSFYQKYIDKLPPGNIIDILVKQRDEVCTLIDSLDEKKALSRYKEGKWTVKEVIGHLIDNERVFSVRALAISRNDPGELPGYDQEAYVRESNLNQRSLQNLQGEYEGLRTSNIQMFSGFSEQMLNRTGIANNYSLSVRAIPFIIAGHERHHLELLEKRYEIELPGG